MQVSTVIRPGSAWGLMIMSGERPSTVNGISTCGRIAPITPFWPWCEENLSPISGMRTAWSLTRTKREPSRRECRVNQNDLVENAKPRRDGLKSIAMQSKPSDTLILCIVCGNSKCQSSWPESSWFTRRILVVITTFSTRIFSLHAKMLE